MGNAALERLRIGIGGNEVHAVHTLADHVIDGVAAGPADADHLDHGIPVAPVSSFSMISNIESSPLQKNSPKLWKRRLNSPDSALESSFQTRTSYARTPA
jgi:hypothetical protein